MFAAVIPGSRRSQPCAGRKRIRTVALAASIAALLGAPASLAAQLSATPRFAALPFGPGEELTFRADIGPFRGAGRAFMRIAAAERVDDRATYPLFFTLNARVGFVRIEDSACSWLDPVSMTARRYQKQERHPLSARSEDVDVFPERGEWTTAEGVTEATADVNPLDELSFLYYVRTLPLLEGDAHSFSRHFDPDRNPTEVRVMGRGQITVPAGTFETILVEMRVRDPARFRGSSIIRMHLTDDARRIPVRIETAFRLACAAVLVLESIGRLAAPGACGA